ncbi:uncharacterized protein HMPREF1541_01009 [Cyphellophora europaea CBS 101466]|uniref:Cytochrome P450 n=1 Tax=Cyphellophora europaea (strain CBS 101466) TaxID=1220924 RepID=W2SDW7_CYPE1|nr:uncharacterized protein HMPREF1541_01009 [Cyphellophora europaea CBS 101466]ETN46820.1 hypothetical protein HMPREF1541_01009 [Cyphellophora europaea CBS 101466]
MFAAIPFSIPLLLTLSLTVIAYLALRLFRHIRYNIWVRTNPEFAKIPHLPQHWLLGNLINVGKHLDPSLPRHPDYGFEEIWNKLDRPPCFWFDMALVGIIVLVVVDPALAEAVTEPRPGLKYSTLKSDTLQSFSRLLGWESLVLVHGEEWRSLRRRFNKGFAPTHLHSLAPLILDRTQIFISRLKAFAQSGEDFLMRDLAQDLTTDIITMVSLERDFGAQTSGKDMGENAWPFGIFYLTKCLAEQAFKVGQGFNLLQSIDPVRPFMAWLNERILNWRLYHIVSEKLNETRHPPSHSTDSKPSTRPSRSIVQLATADLPPNRALINNTVSQIKSFLFAGQDTTATLIQWLTFELSKCTSMPPIDPQYAHCRAIYQALVDEHDAVFGAHDPFSALAALADPTSSEATINTRLPVTNAWVKEALRLHPPAATARYVPLESANMPPFEIPIPNANPNSSSSSSSSSTARINGLRIYNCQYLLHRDPSIWGHDTAALFNPSRWLDEDYVRALPTGAWRPFERGPRNCIGQTLAVLEGVVVLCCVARGFAFEKRGGGKGWGGEEEVRTTLRVTAVVGDGMRMGVKLGV